jgi:hypothetical protein
MGHLAPLRRAWLFKDLCNLQLSPSKPIYTGSRYIIRYSPVRMLIAGAMPPTDTHPARAGIIPHTQFSNQKECLCLALCPTLLRGSGTWGPPSAASVIVASPDAPRTTSAPAPVRGQDRLASGGMRFRLDNTQRIAPARRHAHQQPLDRAIAALQGLAPRRGPGRPPKKTSSTAQRRTMSHDARRRIGAAKKAWWAKQKPARKPPHFSAAARRRLSEMMKERLAERKKAAR